MPRRQLTAIEVNGTYYSGFKPATFAGWAEVVPDDFVFTLKASRFCTNRKVLAEAGESIQRFTGQGIVELGPKLGPILWQFMATKKFDADDFGAFLKLLPAKQDGVALRHAVQVRHDSFHVPEFVDAVPRGERRDRLWRIARLSGDRRCHRRLRLCAAGKQRRGGAARLFARPRSIAGPAVAKGWAAGEAPDGLPYFGAPPPAARRATRSSSSSPARRCATRRPRRR